MTADVDFYHSFLFFFRIALAAHMEVRRLGVESELPLLAYTTAAATQDLSCVCDVDQSSWQCQILNSLSEARDRTCNLMVSSLIH